jgi:hypothetical protein
MINTIQTLEPAMNSLNDCVIEYKKQLAKGDIKKAYQGLMEYIMDLKTFFKNQYPEFSVSSNLYQGHMDMTFFALFPETLKRKKLKIVIVFIHDEIKFEAWLSGVNKQIQAKYWKRLKNNDFKDYFMPSTLKGVDSIIEFSLVDNPDFNNLDALTRQIETGTLKFIKDILVLLKEN